MRTFAFPTRLWGIKFCQLQSHRQDNGPQLSRAEGRKERNSGYLTLISKERNGLGGGLNDLFLASTDAILAASPNHENQTFLLPKGILLTGARNMPEISVSVAYIRGRQSMATFETFPE